MFTFDEIAKSAPVVFDPRYCDEFLAATTARCLALAAKPADISDQLLECAEAGLVVRPHLAVAYAALLGAGAEVGDDFPNFTYCCENVPAPVALGALISQGTNAYGDYRPAEEAAAVVVDIEAGMKLVDGLDPAAMSRVWSVVPRPSLYDAWRVITYPPTPAAESVLAEATEPLVNWCVDSYLSK